MSQQHTQEPVACPYPCGWKNLFSLIVSDGALLVRSFDSDEIGDSQWNAMVSTISHARELCSWGMKQADASARIAELEKQRDTLLAALEELNSVSARGFLYDDPARVKARAAIASVKEQV